MLAVVLLRQKKVTCRIALAAGAFAIVSDQHAGVAGRQRTDHPRVQHLHGGPHRNFRRNAALHRPRCLPHVPQKPVLGWGLGTFPVVYPEFRSFYTNFFVNEAHNDYLQLLAEMGLLGFGRCCGF